MLSAEFLAPYRAKGDPFPNLLARSTYNGKYSRVDETWTDTINRVVEGNISLDPNATRDEAERLFALFWSGAALPPGRGLWTGGVPGIPVDARYNCAYITLRGIEDWAYCANLLMCGCGVGIGLQHIDQLPTVNKTDRCRLAILCSHSHPNRGEVMPDTITPDVESQILVEDSRMGWVNALQSALHHAYNGSDVVFNLSSIRPRGALIKQFGGISCGPAPLGNLLRAVFSIVRGAAGRKLNSVEALDLTNHVGVCIKSGNVRRSALIVLGYADDQKFRDAKKDWQAVTAFRHSSNNSIVFETQSQIDSFDWKSLVDDNSVYGEPGLLNLHKIRQSDPLAEGINPCFRGDTLVHTRQGHFRIDELVGKTVDVWDGKSWRQVDTFQETSQNEPMLKFTMQDGSHFSVTRYHIIVTEDGRRIEAKDVPVGSHLAISNAPESHGEVHSYGAYLKGFLIGDGSQDVNRAKPLLYLYEPKYVCKERLLSSFSEITQSYFTDPDHNGRKCNSSAAFVEDASQYRSTMSGLMSRAPDLLPWCSEYKRFIPKEVFEWNLHSKVEFIAGVMDADGTASDTKNGWLYQICSVEKQWLYDFQMLLKTIGVRSKLALMKESGKVDFKDGYGEYDTKDCWRLTMSQEASIAIANQVKFERLVSFAHKTTTYKVKPKFNQVVGIENDGVDAKVYCLVTDDPNQVAFTNGLIIGRCGEIPLENREFCCLSEVYPALCKDPVEALKLTTRYTLRQRLEAVSDPTADYVRKKNMRLGVGLGGLCDFTWTPHLLKHSKHIVQDAAREYATALGVAIPIANTTVKPSGTISLLNGSSPGIHAPYAPYYVRRTRISVDEPMAQALMEAKVPYEQCVYDVRGKTLVFSFPMKARNASVTVQNESIRDQVERLVAVQLAYADNAVSCSLTFQEHEKDELAGLLKKHINELKSVSCLPKAHGYQQPPYEAISESEYATLHAAINHDHPLTRGGAELEVLDGCEQSGACPVK